MKKKINKRKRKNRGFTFVELLATITVLGLLVMIPIISYSKFLARAHLKYYNSQEDLATIAGKQYFTDYRSALPKEVGSKTSVTLETLYAKKYLERIKDYKGKVCRAPSGDDANNRVYSYKTGKGDYNYYTILECNGYITSKDTKEPVIVFTPKKAISNQNITVVAKITDNKKVDVYSYQIIKNNTVIKEETNKLYTGPISFTLTEEGTYQIKVEATDEWGNKTIKTSEKYVIDKTPPDCSNIRFDSDITPKVWQNKTVKVKVIPHSDIAKWNFKNCFYQANSNSEVCKDDGKGFTGNSIKTLAGAKSKVFANTSYKDNGHVFGKITAYDEAGNSCNINTSEYYVDKDAPVITSKSIASRNSSYNSKEVIIKLTLKDRVDTTNNRIYYSLSNNNKNYNTWYNYTLGETSSINWTLSGDYDGKARTIYIKTKDELGNTKVYTYNTNYKVYKECSEKTGQTTTGSCSTNYGFGTATSTTTYKDRYLGSSCGTETSQTSCCINPKVVYGSFGSCSASCGGGTQSRTKTTYGCNGLVTYDTDTQACNTQACRCESVYYVDGSCSASCEEWGSFYRYAYDNYDGLRCPNNDYYDSCYGGSCCYPTTTYTEWSDCNVSCDYGTQTRTATTYWCDGTSSDSIESRQCYAGSCPTPEPEPEPEPDPPPSKPSDTTPPKCPSVKANSTSATWTENDVKFTVTPSKDTANWKWFVTFANSKNKYVWSKTPTATYSNNKKRTITVSDEGSLKVKTIVYDKAGNHQTCEVNGVWGIDKTPPTIIINDHQNYQGPDCIDRPNTTYRHRYEVIIKDNLSGLYSTKCEWEKPTVERVGIYKKSSGENLCQTAKKVKCTACDILGHCDSKGFK